MGEGREQALTAAAAQLGRGGIEDDDEAAYKQNAR